MWNFTQNSLKFAFEKRLFLAITPDRFTLIIDILYSICREFVVQNSKILFWLIYFSFLRVLIKKLSKNSPFVRGKFFQNTNYQFFTQKAGTKFKVGIFVMVPNSTKFWYQIWTNLRQKPPYLRPTIKEHLLYSFR